MVGSLPSSDASRSHIAVSALIGPSDRYSAMPSANQSGGAMAIRVWSPAAGPPARPDVVLELVRHLVRAGRARSRCRRR